MKNIKEILRKIIVFILGILVIAIALLGLIELSNNELVINDSIIEDYKKNAIINITYDNVDEILSNTGVLIISSSEIKNDITEELIFKYAAKYNIEYIYYLDLKDDRDIKILEDGQIITKKEANEEYKNFLEKVKEFNIARPYEELGEDTDEKRIYTPSLVFIVNGEIDFVLSNTLEGKIESDIDSNTRKQMENGLDSMFSYIKGYGKMPWIEFEGETCNNLDKGC